MSRVFLALVLFLAFNFAKSQVPNGCGCNHQQGDAVKCATNDTPGIKQLILHLRQKYAPWNVRINSFPQLKCASAGGPEQNKFWIHREGRALDVLVQGKRGQQVYNYLVGLAKQCNTGIQEVIFNRRWWSGITKSEEPFPFANIAPHTDHVHVGLNWCGAAKFRAKQQNCTPKWSPWKLQGKCHRGKTPAGNPLPCGYFGRRKQVRTCQTPKCPCEGPNQRFVPCAYKPCKKGYKCAKGYKVGKNKQGTASCNKA